MYSANAIEPVTTLKTRPAALIKRTTATREPIMITQNGKPSAVLQDVQTFESNQQKMLLLKFLLQGEQDVRAGRVVTQQQVLKHIDAKLKDLRTA